MKKTPDTFIAPDWFIGMTVQKKRDLIWSSTFYLTHQLPEDFTKWSDSDLDDWLAEHVWEPFQDFDDDLWQQIVFLADSMRSHLRSSQ